MTDTTKVAELPAKWRAKAKRIRGMTAGSDLVADIMEVSAEDLEAALARQEADKPSAPVGQDDDAHAVMQAFAAGFSVTKNLPWSALTNEANAELAWSVSRTAPPYCDKQGVRIWSGPTASAAVSKGFSALGMTLAAPPAAQAVDLFDDFSESKDWRESDYNGRIDWLKAMHASQRAEIVRLQNDVEILRALVDQQAGGAE